VGVRARSHEGSCLEAWLDSFGDALSAYRNTWAVAEAGRCRCRRFAEADTCVTRDPALFYPKDKESQWGPGARTRLEERICAGRRPKAPMAPYTWSTKTTPQTLRSIPVSRDPEAAVPHSGLARKRPERIIFLPVIAPISRGDKHYPTT
jgi:hypothetical protein